MSYTIYGVLLAAVVVLCTVLQRAGTNAHDHREPTLIKPKTPWIGHLIGLVQHGGAYYSRISSQHPLPVYTLPLLKKKLYVINSLPLLGLVRRHHKKIAMLPFVKMAADRLSGLDKEALDKFDSHEGKPGISEETINGVEHALLHGPEAAALGNEMLIHLHQHLDRLAFAAGEQPACNLLSLVQHIITQVSTQAVYGPGNPMADDDIEKAFWDFEHKMGLLLMGFAPSAFKRKAVEAREKVIEAYNKYYDADDHHRGSALAQARYDAPARYGLCKSQIARLEVAFIIALLNNTVATAYWTLVHIFSREQLLSDLRKEIEAVTQIENSADGQIYTLKLRELKQKCPLLLAVYHEVLRFYTLRPNVRQVMEDFMLDDKYLLKEGTVVQLVTRSIHRDPKHWGDDADEVQVRRFLREEKRKPNSTAFGVFGVAPYVCPGRHFATTEILVMTARMIMQYEMYPDQGTWAIPEQNMKGFSSVTAPLQETKVKIVQREGWQGVWKVTTIEDNAKFPLASG